MSSCSRLTEAPLVVGPVTQALKVEKALPEEVERLMQRENTEHLTIVKNVFDLIPDTAGRTIITRYFITS